MEAHLQTFTRAHTIRNGYVLASTLVPVSPPNNPTYLQHLYSSTTPQNIETDIRYATIYNSALQLPRKEATAWCELYIAYHHTVAAVAAAEYPSTFPAQRKPWGQVYERWKEVANALHRGYSTAGFAAWTVPALYTIGRYLRFFAIKADDEANATTTLDDVPTATTIGEDIADAHEENAHLEDCARQINRLFSLCISDRYVHTYVDRSPRSTTNVPTPPCSAPLAETRKWALYQLATLLFKTYFRLNSLSLTKNILRTLHVQSSTPDFPPLTLVPKSHQVTFHYYRGVTAFLDEDYPQADTALTTALDLAPAPACPAYAEKNAALILTYLIPVRLLTRAKLPAAALLSAHPTLQRLFAPLVTAIKRGRLHAFDDALAAGEAEFVQRRIYLTLERARDVCVRNLFRRVVLLAGCEADRDGVRRSRIRIAEFMAGWRVGTRRRGDDEGGVEQEEEKEEIQGEREQVEWMIANLIYKGLMKGYIAQDHGIVVVSKAGAFPGTGV